MTQTTPRGIEVLVKKAAVDPAFRTLLLDRRAVAAAEIGLELSPSESFMLAAIPREQLETIIAQTSVPEKHRRTFLGKAAVAMLALLGGVAVSATCSLGIRPHKTDKASDGSIQPDQPEGVESPTKTNERTEP